MPLRLLLFLMGLICCLGSSPALAQERLLLYTSMKEPFMKKIQAGFSQAHPDVKLDFRIAGAGRLMAEISDKLQRGVVPADLLWTSEVPDFYRLRQEDRLEPYRSPRVAEVVNPFADYDGSFTAVRLGTVGLAVNSRRLTTPPAAWADLLTPAYTNTVGLADPASSGTAYMALALLQECFGRDYLVRLAANGIQIGPGSEQVIAETATGRLAAALAVDYLTYGWIVGQAPDLKLVYPPEMLVIPSPVAILKGASNPEAARQFIDYLLSPEGQAIIAAEGTIPVRPGVASPPELGLPGPEEALARAVKIDYVDLMSKKSELLKIFTEYRPNPEAGPVKN